MEKKVKGRFRFLLNLLKQELSLASKVGQTLIGASHVSDQINHIYREIGEWVVREVRGGKWDRPADYVLLKIDDLDKLERKIQTMDEELKKLKAHYRGNDLVP